MPFETRINNSSVVASDSDSWPAPPPGCTTGLETPANAQGLLSASPFISPFPDSLRVDESEWMDRAEEMERERSSLDDLALMKGVRVKDQDGYGYCWAFGTCTAVEMSRAYAGLDYVELSATSVAGPVKNFANRGGWGKEALDYGVQHGWAPVSLWPEVPTGASNRYDTHECQLERQKYKVTEWYEIQPRDFNALMSCLFRQMPAAVGLNHWGHLICAVKPVYKSGKWGWMYWNSWKSTWGDRGTGVLLGSKAIPDGVTVVPRVTTVV